MLVRYPTRSASSRRVQLKVGFDTKAKVLLLVNHEHELVHESKTGQSLSTNFMGRKFDVSLGVDKNSPPHTHVANPVEFYVLVHLTEARMSMTLQLDAKVAYLGSVMGRATVKDVQAWCVRCTSFAGTISFLVDFLFHSAECMFTLERSIMTSKKGNLEHSGWRFCY